MSTKKEKTKSTQTLDEQMAQLQGIVEKLEQSGTTIADGIKYFADGVKVAKDCLDTLSQYKGQITELKKECDALIQTEFVL